MELSRLLKTGMSGERTKVDFSSLYPDSFTGVNNGIPDIGAADKNEIDMKKEYQVPMTYDELQTAKDALEFTEMMGDVDGATDLKEKLEGFMVNINLSLIDSKQ